MVRLVFGSVDGRFNLSLPTDLWDELCLFCQNAGQIETGGILIGNYDYKLNRAMVTQVIGPTADSKGGKSWFLRGIKGLQPILNNLWQSRQEFYLGEWHFHPYALPIPSHQDIKQMRQIARTQAYNCPEPLLLIVGGDPQKELILNTYTMLSAEDPIQLFPIL